MKKFTFILLVLVISVPICGQTAIEADSYGLDQYIEKCTDVPIVREINGGTVFKVTYEPEEAWSNSMKGAFEYACKIWEEQLPNTLPINIHVKIGPLRGSGNGNLLSRVLPASYNDYYANEELASRMKYVLLAEYNTGNNVTFMDNITNNEDFFNKTDITITYNQNMLDEFSFSLYSTPVDKYDFVTVALRDIAKGLGFISGFTADASTGAFHNTNKAQTYYEKKIKEAIGSDDVKTAYANSTQGTLALSVPYYGNLNLYAPNVWQNGVSLNYFVPDSTKKISELLAYDFGRGSVIRDISDDYYSLFSELHGWQTYNLATGGSDTSVNSSGTTENVFKYNGTIKIEQNSKSTSSILNEDILSNRLDEDMYGVAENNEENDFVLSTYLFPYHYMYPDNSGNGSWLVSLLKKDGTWDLVYRYNTGSFNIPLEINMSDLNIDSDYDKYQRTCDGYIRCRITHYVLKIDYLYNIRYYSIRNRYYVLDYLPQRVKMGFNTNNSVNAQSYAALDNDYTQVIKIDINGLEGVDRIVVEQLDEGNDLPVMFEVPDFKKGYFTAVVDKELYTQFVVYSYNQNGSTKSETFTVAPLSPMLYNVQIDNNSINLSAKNKNTQHNNTTYVIYSNSLNNLTKIKEGKFEALNGSIDICDLKKGNYILKIKSGDNVQNVKFMKSI